MEKMFQLLNISVVDKKGVKFLMQIILIHFSLRAMQKLLVLAMAIQAVMNRISIDDTVAQRHLFNGKCQVIVQSGTTKSLIHFEAKADSVQWSGGNRYCCYSTGHTAFCYKSKQYISNKQIQLQHQLIKCWAQIFLFFLNWKQRGMKFSDKGVEKDAIQILKDHGFNYVRLRIFDDPQNDSGYSPQKGFCDLAHTKKWQNALKLQA